MKTVYIIGSLKNWKVIDLSNHLRKQFPGVEIFDSWISPGPEADDFWKKYSKLRGLTYREALKDWSATHVFEFDKFHIDRSDAVVMYMPCGKSGHLELGYAIGQGKRGYVLFDDDSTKREVIYKLPKKVVSSVTELENELKLELENSKNKILSEDKLTHSGDKKKICLIGDVTSEETIKKASKMAEKIRGYGFDVIEDWHKLGPKDFDPKLLKEFGITILYQPGSKLGHLELGYAVGVGNKGYILFDKEPETRWDVMYQFASEICMNFEEFEKEIKK